MQGRPGAGLGAGLQTLSRMKGRARMPPKALHELPLVYVAGPYTRPDPVRMTHDAVQYAEAILATGLASVVVPHVTLIWHLISPHDDVEFWYDLDLSHLARCDALYRFPGFSTGADAECQFAALRGIPVFHTLDGLYDWLRGVHEMAS